MRGHRKLFYSEVAESFFSKCSQMWIAGSKWLLIILTPNVSNSSGLKLAKSVMYFLECSSETPVYFFGRFLYHFINEMKENLHDNYFRVLELF